MAQDTTDTVVVVAVVHPLPGRLQEVLDVIAANVPAVHAEDGCLTYAVHTAADPERVIFVERWASAQALAAHAASAHMAANGQRLAPLLAAPTDVWPATSVPLGTADQGVF